MNDQIVNYSTSFTEDPTPRLFALTKSDTAFAIFALAASIFHYGEMTVGELKSKLRDMDIFVRI